MSNVYENKYGVTFGGHHSFRYYSLLPTAPPTIAPPAVNTFYVTVPGADGSLDLTEVLTGYPTYGDRKGTFSFMIYSKRDDWYSIYNNVVRDLNGKRMDVILDEDSEYYYNGRLTVGAPQLSRNKATFSVTGEFSANRYTLDEYSGNDWLWDPFDFEHGIAREYYQIKVRNQKQITLIGSSLVVCPKFTLESGYMTITADGRTYELHQGDNIFLNLLLADEEKIITARGKGVLTITYRIGGVG